MGPTEQFDSNLQMFREPGQEANPAILRFLRWLAERRRLEHEIFGPSTGPYAEVDQPS